jgi:hypothetical protein
MASLQRRHMRVSLVRLLVRSGKGIGEAEGWVKLRQSG